MQLEIIISDSLETYIRKYSAIESEIALYNLTNHKSRETIQQNCSRETQVLTSHKFLKGNENVDLPYTGWGGGGG